MTDTATASLDDILDRLIEVSPPTDDATGAVTYERLRRWILIRNVADHRISTHTADLDRLRVAEKTGSTTKRLLIEMGLPPAAANRSVRIADGIGELGKVDAGAADGRLAGEVVDAIVRGITTIGKRSPTELSDAERTAFETELLTQALSGATPAEILKRAQAIGNTIAEEDGGVPVCDDTSLDTLSHNTTDDGRVDIRANVTQTVGEMFIAMIDERATPRPEPDGAEDRRSVDQRRVDALEQLLDQAAAGAAMDTIGGPRTQTTLLIPADGSAPPQMPWTGPTTQATAKRLTCDGTLTEVIIDGETVPLQMGARTPVPTAPAQSDHHPRPILHQMRCPTITDTVPPHRTLDRRRRDRTRQRLPTLPTLPHPVHHHGWDIALGFDRHPWLVPPADIDPRRRPQPAYNRRTMRLDDAA